MEMAVMETLLKDARYGIRSLLKQPAFTAIAVITLALGIAGNTVIFSAVNSLLVKPLAFPELHRVVAIWEARPSQGVERNEVTMADYPNWRATATIILTMSLGVSNQMSHCRSRKRISVRSRPGWRRIIPRRIPAMA